MEVRDLRRRMRIECRGLRPKTLNTSVIGWKCKFPINPHVRLFISSIKGVLRFLKLTTCKPVLLLSIPTNLLHSQCGTRLQLWRDEPRCEWGCEGQKGRIKRLEYLSSLPGATVNSRLGKSEKYFLRTCKKIFCCRKKSVAFGLLVCKISCWCCYKCNFPMTMSHTSMLLSEHLFQFLGGKSHFHGLIGALVQVSWFYLPVVRIGS